MDTPILESVSAQIDKENGHSKSRSFLEILGTEELTPLIGDRREAIEKIVIERYGSDESRILDLSFEQSANLMASVSELLSFDRGKVENLKRLIKKSINKSAQLRQELECSSVSKVQEYMKHRADLFEKKSNLLDHFRHIFKRLVSLSYGKTYRLLWRTHIMAQGNAQ